MRCRLRRSFGLGFVSHFMMEMNVKCRFDAGEEADDPGAVMDENITS